MANNDETTDRQTERMTTQGRSVLQSSTPHKSNVFKHHNLSIRMKMT